MGLMESFRSLLPKPAKPNFHVHAEDIPPVRDHALNAPTIDRFANYLPYTAFDDESQVFYLESDKPGELEGIGFCIELSPQIGASQEMAEFLTNLFTSGAPTGTGIQVSMLASPVVDNYFESYLAVTKSPHPDMPRDEYRQAALLRKIAERRIEYYRRGTKKPLFEDMNFLMRHFRGVLSVVMPMTDRDDSMRMRDLVTMRESVIAILKAYHLYDRVWNAEDLINWCALIMNPQSTVAGDYPWLHYDDTREIRAQIISRGTQIDEHPDHITFSGSGFPTIAMRAMSVRNYPKNLYLPQMASLIGHLRSYTIAYTCPFVITFGAQITDFDGEKNKMLLKGARATQTLMSPMAKFLPDAGDRKHDYDIANMAFLDGKGTVRMYHQLLLLSPEDDVFLAEQSAKSVWRSEGMDLAVDRKVQKQALLGALPMLFGPLLQKDLQIFQRSDTKTIYNAANSLPMLAEWSGVGARPVLSMFGRRGQVMNIDLFANPSGNYNGVVVGKSGSGKSNLLVELAYRTLATGGRVWIIDIGRSYQKLCRILRGQYVDFTPEADIRMNPFDMVEDIDRDMEMIKPLIAQMIQPSKPLDDYQLSQIEINIRQLWAEYGPHATIDQLASRLMKACYEGGSIAAFGMNDGTPATSEHCDPKIRELGVQLFPYTQAGSYGKFFAGRSNIHFDSNLVVLELQGLDSRKDLRSVVLLMLMYRITKEMFLSDQRDQECLVIIDEAWDLMGSGNAADFIERGYRRARKHRGSFITATQSVEDYHKSQTARAALDNADWMFLLQQKAESIEALATSGKLTLDEYTKGLLRGVTTMKKRFSEVFIRCSDMPPSVGRLFFDPFSMLMASTEADEFMAVEHLVANGMAAEDAIDHLIVQRETTHV